VPSFGLLGIGPGRDRFLFVTIVTRGNGGPGAAGREGDRTKHCTQSLFHVHPTFSSTWAGHDNGFRSETTEKKEDETGGNGAKSVSPAT
jgi:hypothetical protein